MTHLVAPTPQPTAQNLPVQASGDASADPCRRDIADSAQFWDAVGRRLFWSTPYSAGAVRDVSFAEADFRIRWYFDGVLNVSENCLDRHLATRGEQTAIIFEADAPGNNR